MIFEDDCDRKRFLAILVETSAEYKVAILAGCLMGNHFHLVVLTPEGNLSGFMQQLEGRFAQYANWRHERVGHFYQGRFVDVLIENDIHLLTGICYVFLNPVVAGLCTTLEKWKWSTYAATVGLSQAPSYLSLDWVQTLFPAPSIRESQLRLRELLAGPDPIRSYLDEQQASPDRMRRILRSYIGDRFLDARLPSPYRALFRPTLEELFQEAGKDARVLAIHRAHFTHGYTYCEIARFLQTSPRSVRRLADKARCRGGV